jgi:hypothetical protein
VFPVSDLGAYSMFIVCAVSLVVLRVFLHLGNVIGYVPNVQVDIIEKRRGSRASVRTGFIRM